MKTNNRVLIVLAANRQKQTVKITGYSKEDSGCELASLSAADLLPWLCGFCLAAKDTGKTVEIHAYITTEPAH